MPTTMLKLFHDEMSACIRSIANDTGVALRIGAHLAWADGNDPFGAAAGIRLQTILVEPHPRTFALLGAMVAGNASVQQQQQVILENAAACGADMPSGSNITFYTLAAKSKAETQTPGVQFSSTSRQHVQDHMSDGRGGIRWDMAGMQIEALQVPCRSVATLLARHGIAERDVRLLTVDAEGADVSILEAVSWGRVLPHLLVFEVVHVSKTPAGRERVVDLARMLYIEHSYHCYETPVAHAHHSQDMWCVHQAARHMRGCEFAWKRSAPPVGSPQWNNRSRSDAQPAPRLALTPAAY